MLCQGFHQGTIVIIQEHGYDTKAEHGIDLLVMHTKDEDQLAMHGLAYPLAIELRDIPLLLI